MKESEKIKLAAKTVLDALYESHKAGDKKRSAELDQAYGWLCQKYLEAKPLKRKSK